MSDQLDDDRRLARKGADALTTEELIRCVRAYATADEVPPCRVCGGKLSIAACGGGGPTHWACSGQEDDPDNPGRLRRIPGRGIADDHYDRSRWTQYNTGDSLVLELLRRLTPASGPQSDAATRQALDFVKAEARCLVDSPGLGALLDAIETYAQHRVAQALSLPAAPAEATE
jgi:hypothetical protein